MSAYQPMRISNGYIFQAMSMIYHAKIEILGKNLYESHTLFILYSEGNHTLFEEKLYFIWKFSSGNTDE